MHSALRLELYDQAPNINTMLVGVLVRMHGQSCTRLNT